jgi:hypothetical protein
MKHHLVPADEIAHESRIPYVATDPLHSAHGLRGDVVEPTVSVKRVVQAQRGNTRAARNKCFGQVRSDEPVGSRDNYCYTFV